MAVKIGTAPDSWGVWFPSDPKQTPWQRFMDEVVEAGYDLIELGPYGYLPTDVKTLQGELNKRGLKVTGTFVMDHFEERAAWDRIEAQTQKVAALLAAVDAKFLVMIDDVYTDLFTGKSVRSATLCEDEFKQLTNTINRVADLVHRRFNLKVVVHPHAETHLEYEAQIEKLLQQTDPTHVFLCLDTGHHAYRGGDPVAFIRKH